MSKKDSKPKKQTFNESENRTVNSDRVQKELDAWLLADLPFLLETIHYSLLDCTTEYGFASDKKPK